MSDCTGCGAKTYKGEECTCTPCECSDRISSLESRVAKVEEYAIVRGDELAKQVERLTVTVETLRCMVRDLMKAHPRIPVELVDLHILLEGSK